MAFSSSTADKTSSKRKARYPGGGGTPIVTGDVALGAGWGANAVVTSVGGSDSRGWIKITTSALDTPLANPVATLTFHDGAWAAAPFAVVCMDDQSTGILGSASCHCTTTTLVITVDLTPTALLSRTYILRFIVVG